jgi:hypothetical protein
MIVFLGCSVQKKLVKNYKGKNEAFVISNLGKPQRIENMSGGKKIDIYEKRTMLARAPINTGQFQYDRFDSPKATKIETYYFDINSSGIVENVRYYCVYER